MKNLLFTGGCGCIGTNSIRSVLEDAEFDGQLTTLSDCSNNYGPYRFSEKLIPLMILNAIAVEPLPVYGGGQNARAPQGARGRRRTAHAHDNRVRRKHFK